MINTGIYTIEQLNSLSNFKSFLGQDKRISITLYDQILQLPNAEELIERILLLFTDERGAYKRTYANRFEEFDLVVANVLMHHFVSTDNLTVQDVAISDGRTAVDFFNRITNIYQNVDYYASDYNPNVYVIEKDNIKITLSHNFNIIEIVWPPFVFNTVRPDRYWHAPLNRVIQYFVEKLAVKPILNEYQTKKIIPKELFLFCKAASMLSTSDARFKLSAQNILEPFPRQSHIIRAMNILNPTYFSKEEFARIVDNIFDGLSDNGLLILGSNQDPGSEVHGGIYQKFHGKYKLLWRSGNGSCIDQMLLAY